MTTRQHGSHLIHGSSITSRRQTRIAASARHHPMLPSIPHYR
jgi:hypothetical protein